MRISNREKIMLCILGIIILGFLYYQFVYSFEVRLIEAKAKQESELKQKYETSKATIESIDDKRGEIKILKAKIGDESVPFYPVISEEHIILELDKMIKDSGLDGGISFEPVVSDEVENSKKEQVNLPESSLQGIVDKYNSATKDNEKTQQENNKASNSSTASSKSSSNSNEKNNTNSTNKSNTNNSEKSNSTNNKDKKKNTVQYVKSELKVEGSYEGIDKLISQIDRSDKKIVVNSIKISEDTLDNIKASIKLEIYSIPKITDELEGYLKWDISDTYGKNVPFSKGSAGGVTNLSEDTDDFMSTVKSITSDLPTVIMGKVDDDPLKTGYVYANNNGEENAEIILTQDGEKYYYKYRTSKWAFPANYDGEEGVEFTPKSGNIVLNILSETRADSDDKSGIKLKIINKTDKLLKVNITGDDPDNPRVKIDGDGNISVN